VLRSMLHFPFPNDLLILTHLPFLVIEKETLLLILSDDENEKFYFIFVFGECLAGIFENMNLDPLPFELRQNLDKIG